MKIDMNSIINKTDDFGEPLSVICGAQRARIIF